MEVLACSIPKHYVLITEYGFSTFLINDPHSFVVQDIPLRFLINMAYADPSDIEGKKAFEYFFDQFKNRSVKFFGFAALSDLTLKHMIRQYEKPLEEMIFNYAFEDQNILIEKIRAAAGISPDLDLSVMDSPLFVFTRNGKTDPF